MKTDKKVSFTTKVLVRHLTKTPYKATLTGVVVDNTLNIGISLCTPEDNFCRADGRKKSGERAYKSPTVNFNVANAEETKLLFHSFANILQHNLAFKFGVDAVKRQIELTKPKVVEVTVPIEKPRPSLSDYFS